MDLDFKKCPLCGSRRIARVVAEVRREVRGRTVVVPGVAFWHCRGCGERLYDHRAMEKLDRYTHRRRAARVAASSR
jgi:YgiT-type zinc finger domain-containing protein